ncbi:hypothetical protein EVAR_100752_1 [Eumeta japonica]|uniref:Uncharacterized protein n=1 Tax=Eumeta variegata TaxID=151549 RepID=A0A4C1ZD01_EUMVA|nr:hypothetical protein EVAR_100752_1 [Eumeta japonica]
MKSPITGGNIRSDTRFRSMRRLVLPHVNALSPLSAHSARRRQRRPKPSKLSKPKHLNILLRRHSQIPAVEPYNKANIRQSFPVKREASLPPSRRRLRVRGGSRRGGTVVGVNLPPRSSAQISQSPCSACGALCRMYLLVKAPRRGCGESNKRVRDTLALCRGWHTPIPLPTPPAPVSTPPRFFL